MISYFLKNKKSYICKYNKKLSLFEQKLPLFCYKSDFHWPIFAQVKKTSNVSSVEIFKEPFEKTATKKIRRFKYKDLEGV